MAEPSGSEPFASLVARVADLEQALRTQQAEIERLRARAPEPGATPAPHSEVGAEPEGDAVTPAIPPNQSAGHTTRASRRALLKLGGAAAAAGVAAVAASATELAHPGTAHAHSDNVGLYSNISGTGNVAIKGDGSQNANGVEGTTDTGYGLYGISLTGTAMFAESRQGGTGVVASSTAAGGTGAFVTGALVGLQAFTGSGAAIGGSSVAGYGAVISGGLAPLWLVTNSSAGAPTSGLHNAGELYTDAYGTLWYCFAGNGSGLGTWMRLTGVPNGTPGGALNYLFAPIRIFDSRVGQPAPLPTSKVALAGGSTTSIQVTGTSVGGVSVPDGATGVFGNLTVTNTQGGGDLILWPVGVQPLTSNINYGPGQTVANAFSVGLYRGALHLFVHVSGCDVIIDIAGYVM